MPRQTRQSARLCQAQDHQTPEESDEPLGKIFSYHCSLLILLLTPMILFIYYLDFHQGANSSTTLGAEASPLSTPGPSTSSSAPSSQGENQNI